MNLRTERACSLSSTQRMVLRGLINFPSAPLGEAILLQSKEPACGSRRGGRCRSQALSYGRRRGSVRVRNGQARKPVPPVVRGAAVIRAHRARLRKSRERNGMVASAPRVDMGPGPPATACRKCRTATSHDEHSLVSCLRQSVGDADAVSVSGEAALTSVFSSTHMQEQWFCAHAETRSALTQVVSQKWRKLHCRLLDNVPETKQSQASAQRRRCGESARAFAVAFRRKVRRARSA